MALDINHYKLKLEQERQKLENLLSRVARRNPDNPDDWEAKTPDLKPMLSDQGELADKFEEFDTQFGIENQLEERLKTIKEALARIEKGTFGICSECGKKISKERLDASPSAKTCVEHNG